eukprot:6859034-Alexandrium_andersonii.AAC.1
MLPVGRKRKQPLTGPQVTVHVLPLYRTLLVRTLGKLAHQRALRLTSRKKLLHAEFHKRWRQCTLAMDAHRAALESQKKAALRP